MNNFKENLQKVKAFIFDIDGVLSRQTLYIDNNDGGPMRTINLRDGYALQLAVKKGYRLAVISGGNSKSFEKRLRSLGIDSIFMDCNNKKKTYSEFLALEDLNNEEVLYMGDDIPDYEIMNMVGVPVCPEDADSEIKQISCYVSDKKGGEGCVRDIIEQVLRLHGKWLNNDAFYW